MTQSKSLYSLDKMRKHRRKHERILRLRKTDYTTGHLLSTTHHKAGGHWVGGNPLDDGFSYSFEEPTRRGCYAAASTPSSPSSCRALLAQRPWRSAQRGHRSYSNHNSHNNSGRGRPDYRCVTTSETCFRTTGRGVVTAGNGNATRGVGVRSDPRLPTAVLGAGDIYEGGNRLEHPELKMPLASGGREGREGARAGIHQGGEDYSDGQIMKFDDEGEANDDTNDSATNEEEPSFADSDAGRKGLPQADQGRRESTAVLTRENVAASKLGTNVRGAHKRTSNNEAPRFKRSTNENISAKDSGSSTGGIRGSVDTASSRWQSSSESIDGSSHSRRISGSVGRGRFGRGSKRDRAARGRGNGGSGGTYSCASGELSETSESDRLFNPLAFPDEKEGVRILIQATKPLEVRLRACYISAELRLSVCMCGGGKATRLDVVEGTTEIQCVGRCLAVLVGSATLVCSGEGAMSMASCEMSRTVHATAHVMRGIAPTD